ncbi:hypothetical protein [Actinophytocola sp. NPDC049390]|uniref:hypothetical protein n=1 Tax=Actinophytocola sp. NPDC049390 TaxID=3363894 RepID=UPI0037AF0339
MNRTRMASAVAGLAFLGVLATPALASAETPADRAVSDIGDSVPLVGDLLGGSGASGLTEGLPLVGDLLGGGGAGGLTQGLPLLGGLGG